MLVRADRGRCVVSTFRHKGRHDVRLTLLPDSAVDALAQQVGVPAVPGVLLDPVDPQLTHRDTTFADPLSQIRMLGQRRSVAACSRARSPSAPSTVACSPTACSKSASPSPYIFGAGSPGTIQLRQSRSASARWRRSPSNDMVDGGTERRANCSGPQPLALHQQGQPITAQVVLQRRQLAVRTDSVTVAGISPPDLPTCRGRRSPDSSVRARPSSGHGAGQERAPQAIQLSAHRLLVSLTSGPVPGEARSRCPGRRSHIGCPR